MIIKDAVQATEEARRIIGNPIRFQPKEAKRVSGYWVVEAVIGVLDDILVTVKLPETVLEVKKGYVKAILVEHRFPIPEEFREWAKAMLALDAHIRSEVSKTSRDTFIRRNTAFKEAQRNLYIELVKQIGMVLADYPVWDISDSGDELIGYKYEFQEEG